MRFFKPYHPHDIHDPFWLKALIYSDLMIFMHIGVQQNEKQSFTLTREGGING